MRHSDHILSPEDLKELTGYVQSDKQGEILRQHGIFYITRSDNQIRTTWHHVNHPASQNSGDGFNLEALTS